MTTLADDSPHTAPLTPDKVPASPTALSQNADNPVEDHAMDGAPETTAPVGMRCGWVVLLGEANAGKSTLVNALTGEKVSIVSSKPHTTRHGIYGIVCRDQTQLIFVDTPGLIHAPKGLLQTFMARMTKRGMRDGDVIVVVIDATRPVPPTTVSLLQRFQDRRLIIVLNKVDIVERTQLLPLADHLKMYSPHIVMTSALKEQGVDYLFQLLDPWIPQGPWLFDADALTQMTQRFWAAEITREKVFEAVHHEVPYHTHVVTDEWKERKGEITIRQRILVDQDRYRKWILGFEGKRIKRIGHQARLEMSTHMNVPVHLFLHVDVDPSWFQRMDVGG